MRSLAFLLLALQTLPAFAAAGDVVLQDVRLIDGTGANPVDHVSIVVHGAKIAQIVKNGADLSIPAGAQVMKLTGKTVMPGIINGHGHLGLVGDYTAENIEKQLRQYERYGVTTMISLGMNRDLVYKLRSQQETGVLGGATLLTADRGIGIPGGMPPMNVPPDQIYRPTTPEEARKDVDAMAARDANLVKVWVDDSLHKLPPPNPEIYAAVIDEAHKQHLRVAAHVYYLTDAKRLLTDGVDILAHSVRDQELDPEAVSLIKNKGVYYIPTLQLEESFFIYADHPAWMNSPFFTSVADAALFTSAEYRKGATPVHRKALQTAMANIKKLQDAGAEPLIAFGTDSGATPYRIQGFAEHRELQLMVQAGLTPMQVIRAATSINAKMLHIDEKTGSIQVGKQADLLVLDADPSQAIANTEKINLVLHNGVRQERN